MEEMEDTGANCVLIEAHLEDAARCKTAMDEVHERFGDV